MSQFKKSILFYSFLAAFIVFSSAQVSAQSASKNTTPVDRIDTELFVSHILLETQQEAIRVHKIIKDQIQDFPTAAKNYSIGPSKVVGGYLGKSKLSVFPPNFREALIALGNDEISNPVKTEYGWHIIKRHKVSVVDTVGLANAEYKNLQKLGGGIIRNAFQDARYDQCMGREPPATAVIEKHLEVLFVPTAHIPNTPLAATLREKIVEARHEFETKFMPCENIIQLTENRKKLHQNKYWGPLLLAYIRLAVRTCDLIQQEKIDTCDTDSIPAAFLMYAVKHERN